MTFVLFWLLLVALVVCCVVLGWGTAVWLARPGEQRRREHLARLEARNAALEASLAAWARLAERERALRTWPNATSTNDSV